MLKSMETKHFFEFGDFRLDTVERVLLREGKPVALAPKVFETLLLLVQKNGHIVERDELMNRVWSESFVEEGNLTYTISVLRKTLAEASGETEFIETVPKRGYRFKPIVRDIEDKQTNVVFEKHTTANFIIEESDTQPLTEILQEKETTEIVRTPQVFSNQLAVPIPAGTQKKLRNKAMAAVSVLIALSLLSVSVWFFYKPQPATTSSIKSIAVLPFKTLAATGDDVYLELGMADALITNLSNVQQIVVRPTSAVRQYMEKSQSSIDAGRDLNVDAILEGSVQRQEDRIRITVRLVNVKNAQPLWGAKFDEKFTDIFALQDSIAEQITRALALELTKEEKRLLAKRYTDNTQAYQDYLRGRFYWSKWTKESLQKAIENFEQALAKDKDYALAYGGLADSYGVLGYLNILPPKEAYPKSKEAALKALELDPAIGESYVALAQSKLFYEWDFAGAEKDLQRAITLSPNYADGHSLYGTYLTAVGRLDEALAERKRAAEIDPVNSFTVNAVGWVYFYKRDYDQALEWHKKAIELDASFAIPHQDVGNACYQKGMYTEAVDEYLKQQTLSGASALEIEALRQAFHSSGVQGYWKKELELANQQMKQGHVRNWRMVRIYTYIGDNDRIFEYLEKAYAERESLLIFLNVNPVFANLHSDKRFQNLIQRIGFIQ
jgi:TolB-like protein/DNA-binding winged helix-turn-helix (wHTH) protein/Tfp pilus assembly protein PilF